MTPHRFVVAALCAAASLPVPAAAQVACPQPMSGGSPPVRAQHVFCGEINHNGRAVGFHSRPGGKNPDTVSHTRRREDDPRRPGIYTLFRFEITQHGVTRQKAVSTMYPDRCSAEDVIAAIQQAYNTGTRSGGSFTGLSGPHCTDDTGRAFRIQGFTGTRNGRTFIITAYPN